jgi:hypothetical protein
MCILELFLAAAPLWSELKAKQADSMVAFFDLVLKVRFLRYIRQWGKKIIFILNKCDILSNSRQVKISNLS